MSSKYIKDILMDYERKKSIAEEAARNRKFEIYSKIPKIKSIDTELSSMGIEIAKSIFNKNVNVEKLIATLREKSIDLKIEKAELLTKHNFPMDYIEPQYSCILCKDTGYVDSQKCNCLKQSIIDRYYNQSNLKDILKKENFETFVFDYYSSHKFQGETLSPKKNMEEIFSTCVNFVKDFDESHENLFFYGNSGLGKTFLSNSIAKDLLDRGRLVIYQTSTGLLDILKEAAFGNGDESLKGRAKDILECDLLIIDDLGTEYYKTEFSQMELYNVINKRLLTGKKMVISTNLFLEELMPAYAERLTSRILGNFTMCKFYGEDIRMKIGEQNRKKRKK